MSRQNNINNSITEDGLMSNDILVQTLKNLSDKLDTVITEFQEMKINLALKSKDYDGKFEHVELRLKVLEDERAANAKKPMKYEIMEKVMNGFFLGFGLILASATGIFVFKAMGIPVSTILKTLFISLGA